MISRQLMRSHLERRYKTLTVNWYKLPYIDSPYKILADLSV